ncbi:unnamed protein product [Oncorhynchus mykiss]|uniref:WW domain-containing protein n=1 Tax=Oncorhynchus mykiss TaxID=8022 RepID=A0A060WUK2_ONCMY|nr:unnamed protein product [Oncorhynchus mykiss]
MYPTDETVTTVSPSGQGGRPESPVYSNLQELKISRSSLPPNPSSSPLHVLGDWETHKDQNGRHYYFNRATQERTWKPPRAKDASSSRGETHSKGTGEAEVRRYWDIYCILETHTHTYSNTHSGTDTSKCKHMHEH